MGTAPVPVRGSVRRVESTAPRGARERAHAKLQPSVCRRVHFAQGNQQPLLCVHYARDGAGPAAFDLSSGVWHLQANRAQTPVHERFADAG